MSLMKHSFFLVLHFLFLDFSISSNFITQSQFIKDPQVIISEDSSFRFGFFSPPNTTNRYVGVLYNIPTVTPIWVANRNRSLEDSEGSVTVSSDGNLVVLDGQNRTIWSTDVSNILNVVTKAELLDNGNLVLRDNSSGVVLWESFKNPSDSIVPKMEIGERNRLISWRSSSDPSPGTFSVGIDASMSNLPQIMIWNNSQPYWRSGPWNRQIFLGIPMMNFALNGFDFEEREGEGVFFTFKNLANETTSNILYYRLEANGDLVEISRSTNALEVTWRAPTDECDIYGKCGPYGICESTRAGVAICKCIKGFTPQNQSEWNAREFSSGCVRKAPLSMLDEGKNDRFLKLSRVKVPDFGQLYSSEDRNCDLVCLNTSSCVAFACETGIGCIHWHDKLIDIKRFSDSSQHVYIRLASSELAKEDKIRQVFVYVGPIAGFIIFAIVAYIFWKWKTKPKGNGSAPDHYKVEESVVFAFSDLAAATENFVPDNKIGEGGFGEVYKGKLRDGREIAVKRLSQSSRQGLDEFMNEVVVISKLQHRNLVRLLGYCVERQEKILVYEYVTNRTLDAHLFESRNDQESLDWSKRINIIEGIERGLVYLHRDSRLKIIHRDLKPSNILLDNEFNPKISDFGMAKIFKGDQELANTGRLVGTYGYMAPEYASEGQISEKSDVFSFGVLLLEIVSGRRNSSFYHDEFSSNLLAHAWKLWTEEKIEELIDPQVSLDPEFQPEILRYIHVGLLCVQEDANDRPNASTVMLMLTKGLIDDLPTPKQPAFTQTPISVNHLLSGSITAISQGR